MGQLWPGGLSSGQQRRRWILDRQLSLLLRTFPNHVCLFLLFTLGSHFKAFCLFHRRITCRRSKKLEWGCFSWACTPSILPSIHPQAIPNIYSPSPRHSPLLPSYTPSPPGSVTADSWELVCKQMGVSGVLPASRRET